MAQPILVVIFLRGGMDGLSLVAPAADPDYIAARAAGIRVVRTGGQAGLPVANKLADVDFRLHPAASPLKALYDEKHLAIVHACGLVNATRSHFEAEDYIERGVANDKGIGTGWLARWIDDANPQGLIPALAIGSTVPVSLLGAPKTVAATDLSGLRLAAGHGYRDGIFRALAKESQGHPLLQPLVQKVLAVQSALDARVTLDDNGELKPYAPADGVQYPDNELGNNLKALAQILKLDLGTQIGAADYGGWDTHVNQASVFAGQVEGLSRAVEAFWRDLGALQDRTVILMMSEFGRRLKSNESGGTDHGHGNVMLVLGAAVKGGRIYGSWPTLKNDALDSGADLAVTTDVRRVLAGLVTRHLGASSIRNIFPGLSEPPLDVM